MGVSVAAMAYAIIRHRRIMQKRAGEAARPSARPPATPSPRRYVRTRASYVYITPHASVQLRRHLGRLLLREDRLVHVAAVLETHVRVVGRAGHGHQRCKFRVGQ